MKESDDLRDGFASLVALWKFQEVARYAKGICTARDVTRHVRINARIYPSLLLATCKCVKKCVRLWLANQH
jgi:hypothetical protein